MNHFALLSLTTRYKHAMDFNSELFDDVLKKSEGQPQMSDEDIKMVILTIHASLGYHRELIQDIIEALAEEPKKKFWQFWK
jgi:hypothetical protein